MSLTIPSMALVFVNAAGGDFGLAANSPVIDRGNNIAPDLAPTDLDGRARCLDGDGDGDGVATVDLGAFER